MVGYAKVVFLLVFTGMLFVSLCVQAQDYVDPDGADLGDPGYFPTYNDTLYQGGYSGHTGDYPRSSGGNPSVSPDQVSMTSSGLWAYDDPEPNFYERHPMLFRPVDSVFGLFSSHELIGFESRDSHSVVAEVDINAPIGVTRNFDPQRAMFKVGPGYFDVMYVGAGVLFSDYQGPPLANDDGWIGIVELGVRGAVRLTDSLYIVANGFLYYLPFENEFGFDFSGGSGGGSFARVGFEFQTGEWDWFAYNQVSAFSPFYDLFQNLDEGAADYSGRYRFGTTIYEDRDRQADFFEEDLLYFANQLGIKGEGPTFAGDWRLRTSASRWDSWRTLDFDDHQDSYHAGAVLGYEGVLIPFAPYFSYDGSAYDDFDEVYHRASVGGTQRLTENLTLHGRGGYLWATGREPDLDQWIWSAGIQHQLNERTFQSLSGGQDFSESVIGEVLVADYIQYNLQHRMTARLNGGLFAQYAESERIRPVAGDSESIAFGGRLNYNPGDFSRIGLSAYYQEFHDNVPGDFGDYDRWVYRADWRYRLFSRTYSVMTYQYEDYSRAGRDFDEHLLRLSIRTYF
jgi:hypothetical protein